jgi:hypothetical protein
MIHAKAVGEFFTGRMSLLLTIQSQIPNLASITRVLTHGAELLAVWLNLKFECLKAFHRSIMVGPWKKTMISGTGGIAF